MSGRVRRALRSPRFLILIQKRNQALVDADHVHFCSGVYRSAQANIQVRAVNESGAFTKTSTHSHYAKGLALREARICMGMNNEDILEHLAIAAGHLSQALSNSENLRGVVV